MHRGSVTVEPMKNMNACHVLDIPNYWWYGACYGIEAR